MIGKIKSLLFGNLLRSIKTILSKPPDVPLDIWITSWRYPVIKYENDTQFAKGEIEKFRYVESCRNQQPVGRRVVGLRSEDYIDYGCIWVQLGRDWYKLISKTYERSC